MDSGTLAQYKTVIRSLLFLNPKIFTFNNLLNRIIGGCSNVGRPSMWDAPYVGGFVFRQP